MARGFRLRVKAGQATAIKGVEDMADRLIATTELVGNLTGMVAHAGWSAEFGNGAQ
jgi:hypothetical protein